MVSSTTADRADYRSDTAGDEKSGKALFVVGGVGGFLAAFFVAAVTLAWATTGWDDATSSLGSSDAVSLLEGQRIYVTQCAACHGADGEGGIGLRLAGGALVEKYPDIEAQVGVITNGRADMPAFKNTLSPAEIEAVARFERESLGR